MESPVAPRDIFVSLDEDEAYAGTSYSDWRLLATETEAFKTLKIEDLGPENQACEICFEPFHSSETQLRYFLAVTSLGTSVFPTGLRS